LPTSEKSKIIALSVSNTAELTALYALNESKGFGTFVNEKIKETLPIMKELQNTPELLKRFFFAQITSTSQTIEQIMQGVGKELDVEIAKEVIKPLFENGFDRGTYYFATTVCDPRNHFRYFPGLLDSQNEAILEAYGKNKKVQSYRILLLTRGQLFASHKHNQEVFMKFINFHVNGKMRGIQLFRLEPKVAEEIMKKVNEKHRGLLTSKNVSIWENGCSIQFTYIPNSIEEEVNASKSIRLKMACPKDYEYYAVKEYSNYILSYIKYCENPKEYIEHEKKTLFDNLKESGYMPDNTDCIINLFDFQNQKLLTEMKSPSRFSESTAKFCPYVVDPQIRIKRSARFLVDILIERYGLFIPEDLSILDVAGGLGIESAMLQNLGYKVVYNEPGEYLYNEAVKELAKLGTIEKIKYEDLDTNIFIWDEKLASKFFGTPYPLDFIDELPKTSKKVHDLVMFNYSILLLENWFYGEKRFKVLLALANFISHLWSNKPNLKSNALIKEYISAFKNLLKPTGTIILDHRNFTKIEYCIEKEKQTNEMSAYDAYIKPLSEDDIRSKWDGFKPYQSDMYYCGNIKYGPYSKTTTVNGDTIINMVTNEKKNNEEEIKNQMYPLHVDEVKELLNSSGFEDIYLFTEPDFRKGILLGDDKYQEDRSSDYYFYIATKSKD